MYIASYSLSAESNYHSGTAAGDDWLFKGSLLVTVTRLIEVRKPRTDQARGYIDQNHRQLKQSQHRWVE